jgi:hypothetical protein
MPSFGDVPRPNSSTKTKVFWDASPVPVFNIKLENTTDDANQESWQKTSSHLQMCSSFFPSDRYSTSGSRVHCEFYVKRTRYQNHLQYIEKKPNLKLAYSAGTKHPHIAMMLSNPICRKYVLFPIYGWGLAWISDER